MSPDNQLKEQLERLKNNVVKGFSVKEGMHDAKNNEKTLDDESVIFKEFADKLITQTSDSKRTVRQVQDAQFFFLSGRSL